MEKLRCIIDLGNWYIKWLLILDEEDKSSILAKEMIKTSGMKRGRILDWSAFMQTIKLVIDSLSKKIDTWIDSVTIWLSNPQTVVKRIRDSKRLLQMDIWDDDVNGLLNNISDASWEINYEVLKIIPVYWIIDDELKVKDPLWMQGRKVELVADVFLVPSNFYNDIIKLFDELWLDIDDILPNILWVEEAVLDIETKDLWSIIIDIGTNQTSFVIYEDWNSLWYWVIPVGSEEITKDISIWLKIDIKEAEKVKKEKWLVLIENTNEYDDQQLDIRFLSEIISARYEEDIFNPILFKMEEIAVDGRLPWWVILVWWWSKVINLDEFAKQHFKLSSRFGNVAKWWYWELWNNLQFISILWSSIWEKKYGEDSISKNLLSFNFNFNIFKKIWEFFKKIF